MESIQRKSLRTQLSRVHTPFRIRDRVRQRMPPAHRKEAKRFVKFAIVGSIGFVIDTGVLSLLVFAVHMDTDNRRLAAKAVSFTLAVISNFIWNRLWTYPESRSKPLHKQLTQFFVLNVIGLFINLLVFGFVDNLLITPFGPVLALYGAQICAVGVAMVWNFISNRLITFNDVKFG